MCIAVVLHHACIKNIRQGAPVKFGEILFGECSGYLNGAVAAEIEKDDGIAVMDCASGFS